MGNIHINIWKYCEFLAHLCVLPYGADYQLSVVLLLLLLSLPLLLLSSPAIWTYLESPAHLGVSPYMELTINHHWISISEDHNQTQVSLGDDWIININVQTPMCVTTPCRARSLFGLRASYWHQIFLNIASS